MPQMFSPKDSDQVIFKRPLLPAYPARTVAEPKGPCITLPENEELPDAAEAFVAGAVSLGCIPSIWR